jgi:hypothetical protein
MVASAAPSATERVSTHGRALRGTGEGEQEKSEVDRSRGFRGSSSRREGSAFQHRGNRTSRGHQPFKGGGDIAASPGGSEAKTEGSRAAQRTAAPIWGRCCLTDQDCASRTYFGRIPNRMHAEVQQVAWENICVGDNDCQTSIRQHALMHSTVFTPCSTHSLSPLCPHVDPSTCTNAHSTAFLSQYSCTTRQPKALQLRSTLLLSFQSFGLLGACFPGHAGPGPAPA